VVEELGVPARLERQHPRSSGTGKPVAEATPRLGKHRLDLRRVEERLRHDELRAGLELPGQPSHSLAVSSAVGRARTRS